MIATIIEVGIRTSVWLITKSCTTVYYLCFGSKQERKQKELEQQIILLENRIKMLENS